MERMTKTFDGGELIDVSPGSREVVACISSSCVDRDKEIVLPSGMKKKSHAGMTVFYDHDTSRPVASCQWVKASGDKLLAKHRFTDKTELGRDMFALVQDGVLRSYSIGFQPDSQPSAATREELSAHPEWSKAKRVIRSYDLLEYSLVGIPANPDALTLCVAKGLISAATGVLLKRVPLEPTPEKTSTVTLNHSGESHARQLISEGKINRDADWSFDAADGNTMLSAHGGDWTSYGRCFLGEDHYESASTKGHWHYPVVKGGKVFISGLRAAISRSAQQHDTVIEDAAQALLAAAKSRKSALEWQIKLAQGLATRFK